MWNLVSLQIIINFVKTQKQKQGSEDSDASSNRKNVNKCSQQYLSWSDTMVISLRLDIQRYFLLCISSLISTRLIIWYRGFYGSVNLCAISDAIFLIELYCTMSMVLQPCTMIPVKVTSLTSLSPTTLFNIYLTTRSLISLRLDLEIIAYPSGASEFTPGFQSQWGSCYSIFSFMCMFCRSFILFTFFCSPLCCLFFFDLWILITPFVSSNSSLLPCNCLFHHVEDYAMTLDCIFQLN